MFSLCIITDTEGHHYGFPKSSYLKDKRVWLGNTARNLAAQSVHRISSFEEVFHEDSISHFSLILGTVDFLLVRTHE